MLIEERPADDEALSGLVAAAFAELVAKYGPEGRSGVHPEAGFLVAVTGGRAVGCGAVQPVDAATGELKRMYVVPDHRGRGVARSLLKALEDLARARGHAVLRLATGHLQPEAINLYRSSGYEPIPPYGKYVNVPTTFCFAKVL
ncbi:GNAT family N-acetyltransferase [Planomonospora venezuelensis]|uniref:GNAT superfamily N-acetyltransferase n=1 Tax=Planomonospora venezuelensis TaxID=1999 RepID=A0A841D791_PLAVE|nr:GNAT family N-acetyltransferase [Planomonospora venezuelensis]MBB5966101.1 GNAT superfamily N-acetyltransferase [Planomonospora venezuelensis]GIN03587.1 N-acetyltransferase [Planomonospora venezuelensis]